MAAITYLAKVKKRFLPAEVAISLGLFLLALWPRAYDLPRFVTADEAKWVYRSAQFLAAFLNGDFAATKVNLTPAVTTTWLGSLGLSIYYYFNQATINIPFGEWLTSLPEFRTELPVLVATRWPMVIFTSLGVVAMYLLAHRLFNPFVAFVGAGFIALDAHSVALSRILGHDAPVTVFMTLSLLLLLLAVNNLDKQQKKDSAETSPLPSRSAAPLLFFVLSGLTAGLAFLSKAPALFLIPFTALIFIGKGLNSGFGYFFWLKRFFLWILVAYLTFIAIWPAAWVSPVDQPVAVVENAFLSATDQEEADTEGYWRVPNLGPFYYLVNGAFKLSPLVMVGVGLTAIFIFSGRWNKGATKSKITGTQYAARLRHLASHLPTSSSLFWLTAFVILFTIFMTLSDKRSPRYILPVFPPLALIAALGWLKLYRVAGGSAAGSKIEASTSHIPHPTSHIPYPTSPNISHMAYPLLLIASALVIIFLYTPYYFSYFNPLLGGSYTAPHLVKIGWGEGLDQVGRFLQRELKDSRVGTAYASTVAPYFKGDISSVTGDKLDYVVLYSKQVQSGQPSPAFVSYFEQTGPIFSVELNGIHYADVYPGPSIQPSLTVTAGVDSSDIPQPVGFRPLTPYGHIGQSLEVDVLWLAGEPLPATPSIVTLAPISVFDFTADDQDYDRVDTIHKVDGESMALAEGEGNLNRVTDDLVVSHHRLTLPIELERGVYALLVDGRPLGEVELRHFEPPPNMAPVDFVVFDDQIGLIGYQFHPAEDYISVTIAWQAIKSRLPDYTVFVQLLDAETDVRVAGIDTQPVQGKWPTSRWVKGEVVVDEYLVAMPPDLAPGFYKMIVGLYRPETGQRLTQTNGRDYWVLPSAFIRK